MPEAYRSIQVTVNGETYQKQVSTRKLLSDFLRDDLRLTGTHVGCEHGICGACTVIVNGATVRSCLMLASRSVVARTSGSIPDSVSNSTTE